MKGSVCFVLKFALPPFSPLVPSGVQISKQAHRCTLVLYEVVINSEERVVGRVPIHLSLVRAHTSL